MNAVAYLDYNATAPTRSEVIDAVADALHLAGNPSSVHGPGRLARAAVEKARAQVAGLVGVSPGQVTFTSGGTEANSLALLGCARSIVLVSAAEHDSVLNARGDAAQVRVKTDGVVDLDDLAGRLADCESGSAIVSLMLANNETGVIQPVAQAARLAKDSGALVHTDAVQAAGRLQVDFKSLDVDLMTLSAHKIGGPKGVGALIARNGITVQPIIRGGGQERRQRGGTENVPGIVGFGVAAELAGREAETFGALAARRDRLESEAAAAVPNLHVAGAQVPRLANTSCLAVPGVGAEVQVMALDLAGVAVSAGSACSSGKVEPSHVLRAMGVDETLAGSAIRVSLGLATTDAEIDRFLEAWIALSRRVGAAA